MTENAAIIIIDRRVELKAAALHGLWIAGALDLLWLGWLFPAMDPSRWGRAIASLTCLVQTVFTTGGVVFFAWLHRRLSMDAWLAVPYGALAGALSLGLSIGVRTLLGMRAGIFVMLGEFTSLNSAPALAQFLEGFRGGMAFGMMGGLLAGMAGSLALSIWRGRQERSKKGPWKEALNIPRRIPEDLFSE